MDEKEKRRFYNSEAWQEKRLQILRRDHWQCQECLRRVMNANTEGRTLAGEDRIIARATQVHHIIHLEDAPELGLADDNLEAVCLACHNKLHGRDPNAMKWKRKKKTLSRERW